jgi:hypothetical protein
MYNVHRYDGSKSHAVREVSSMDSYDDLDPLVCEDAPIVRRTRPWIGCDFDNAREGTHEAPQARIAYKVNPMEALAVVDLKLHAQSTSWRADAEFSQS